MEKTTVNKAAICIIVLAAALLISVGINLLLAFDTESYLQDTDEIYIMEARNISI